MNAYDYLMLASETVQRELADTVPVVITSYKNDNKRREGIINKVARDYIVVRFPENGQFRTYQRKYIEIES